MFDLNLIQKGFFSRTCLSTYFIKRKAKRPKQTLIAEAIKADTEHHQVSGRRLVQQTSKARKMGET